MTADSTAFDEFLLAARDDLRRAYTGTTSAADIPTVVASALAYARTHAEVVARAANPVGYLYRAGHTKSDASTRGWRASPGSMVPARESRTRRGPCS